LKVFSKLPDERMLNAMRALSIIFLIFAAGSGWSFTVSGTTYATNGSQSDVQAACNAAPDNGTVTVVIPNGAYSWTGKLTIRKSLTLAGASATGVRISNNFASGDMIEATASAKGNINIYWLNITQIANNSGGAGFMISADRTEPSSHTVLIHDCTFNVGTVSSYSVAARANGIIFWNDQFVSGHTGIYFCCDKYGPTGSWNTPASYGTQDTTGLMNSYVENCSFASGSEYLLDIDDNSRVVFRNNTVKDSGIGSHGQESSMYGCREWEIYNNTFVATPGNPYNNQNWFMIRGGSGVIWGNSMQDIGPGKCGIQFCVFSINLPGQIPCQTGYPAARQVGQGWSPSSKARFGNPVVPQDGMGAVTEGVYIWNNSGTASTNSAFIALNNAAGDKCGNRQVVSNYVQPGRDYFTSAKPNYTPYTYPHPLHAQLALSGRSLTGNSEGR
jgi:hypothetical protein